MKSHSNSSERSTSYSRAPLQTQSLGTQFLQLDIGELFTQCSLLATADGLLHLVDGNAGSEERVAELVRKHRLAKPDLSHIRQVAKALPKMPSPTTGYGMVAQQLDDLANPNGCWLRKFESHAQDLVDGKVAEILKATKLLGSELVTLFDFQTAIKCISELESYLREQVEEKAMAQHWKPEYSSRLKHSAVTYHRFNTEASQKKWLGLKRKRLSKDSKVQLEQLLDKDIQYAQQRVEQLKAELQLRIARRIVEVDSNDSLPSYVRELEANCDSLRQLNRSIRSRIKPLKDNEMVTNVVYSAVEPIEKDVTFYDLICGAFASNGCGPTEIAKKLRSGITYRGSQLSPIGLSNMEPNQAEKLAREFAAKFFVRSAESVYGIDLTEEALQLPLAKAFATACEKAAPYLRFGELQGVQRIKETYMHCHPDVRSFVEIYRPGTVNFSNPKTDVAFHIPEKHVLTITTNVLGPAHTRDEFAKCRYARDKLIGKKTFRSIYPFDQPMAQPLAIASRPSDRKDSFELFNLALKYGMVVARSGKNRLRTYSLNPMDETVRFCFEIELVQRRSQDAYYFTSLLDEPWFIDFVDANIDGLPFQWSEKLIDKLDSASGEQIAKEMVAMGILEKHSKSRMFRISCPNKAGTIRREELYKFRTTTRAGLSRKVFVEKLLHVDELYTRVLEDIISAEAQGRIPYRKLTEFAKRQVDIRRQGIES